MPPRGPLLPAMLALILGCGGPPAEPSVRPPIRTRKTAGETTQTVLDLAAVLTAGGVVVDPGAARAGLDVVTGAYRAAAGQISVLAVDHAVQLYEAEHGFRPKTHSEFMAEIIRPGTADGLRLPMLPYDQEYAFDPDRGGIVVVEFPARREQRQRETTGAAGP